MQQTKLIIFDCDGVLVDSEVISANVLALELAKLGITVSRQQVFDRFVGRSLSDVAESLNIAGDRAVFERFSEAFHTAVLSAFTAELAAMRGIEKVISNLKVPYCVATSSSRQRVLHSLSLSKLDHYFGENVFTASQVERGKPSPDLFLFAAQNMGAARESCLVIEDSLPGVQAAQAAQMRVLRFTGGSHFASKGMDPTADARGIVAFDSWERFFDLDPELKICAT